MKQTGKEKVGFSLIKAQEKIIQLLQKGDSNITEVSETLDIPKEDIFDLLDKIRGPIYKKTGYLIEFERKSRKISLTRETFPGRILEFPKINSQTVKILFTSDWGLGLKTQQGDLIATVFEQIEKEEDIYFSVVAGNLCAGKPKTKKDIDDHFLSDYKEELDYLVEHFPHAGFKHYIINSYRELSFSEPKTIGEALAERRKDIKCYGNHQTSFLVGDTLITVSHLDADASAYTLSYGLEVAMERYQDATEYVFLKENTPNILLMGGINADFEIPPELPLKKERKNNFYAQTIPSLHTATKRQLARRGRTVVPFELGYLILTLEFDRKGRLTGEPIFDVRHLTAYVKKDDYLSDVVPSEDLEQEEKKLIIALNEKPYSKGILASKILRKSIPHVAKVIKQLQEKGYKIIWLEAEKRFKLEKSLKEKFEPVGIKVKKSVKFAAISDTHLAHKNERPDLLKRAYEISEARKVDRIFHCGDVFEGAGAHPFHEWELLYIHADEQRDHGLEVWPKSKIQTDIIRGSTGHETAFLDIGHDIVDTFCKLGRGYKIKLNYLGGMTGVSTVKGFDFRLLHPRGGIPRGKSYRPQRLVENMVKTIMEYSREKVLLTGHLHIGAAMFHKGILEIMVPCLLDTTDFLKASGHTSWLGMWICEIYMDKYNNIIRTVREYVPFEPKEEFKKSKKRRK
jgi:predicted phosphodiesterase